jgi:hypothetical protein
MVQKAYNFSAWDGLGNALTTSMPDAGPAIGITTIGVATGEQILFLGQTDTGTWAGQTVTGATTLAMYTYAGDLNFDGLVDATDYGAIDNWIQFPGSDGYANGDFNYDGIIDASDYGIIDNTIQLQGDPIPTNGSVAGLGLHAVTAVPEPTSLSVLGLTAAASLLGHRSRRGRCAARKPVAHGPFGGRHSLVACDDFDVKSPAARASCLAVAHLSVERLAGLRDVDEHARCFGAGGAGAGLYLAFEMFQAVSDHRVSPSP